MEHLLTGLQHTWFGQLAHRTPLLFSICETIHFVGLSVLVGALLLMDLRMMGFCKSIPLRSVLKLAPVAGIGLGLNVASGAVMFASQPIMYWTNPAFILKMIMVVLATANASWFILVGHQRKQSAVAAPSGNIKIPAIVSLVLWAVVILLGRLLPTFATVPGG